MLHEIFVQGVRKLQPAYECKCTNVLIAVGDLSQLVLEVASVRFEAVSLSHLDGEKVMVIRLSLLARCIVGDECFGHLREVAERMWRQIIELICDHTFQTGKKSETHEQIVARVYYYFISEMPDVLDRITYSIVEGWS